MTPRRLPCAPKQLLSTIVRGCDLSLGARSTHALHVKCETEKVDDMCASCAARHDGMILGFAEARQSYEFRLVLIIFQSSVPFCVSPVGIVCALQAVFS